MTDSVAYSIAEAAAASGVSADYIKRSIHATDRPALRAKKAGAKYLIRRVDLEKWLEGLPDA